MGFTDNMTLKSYMCDSDCSDLPVRSPLDAVHPCPGRHQGQNAGHQVHQGAGRVALVAARLPQLVQTRASDHQRRVELQTIGPERRILKKLLRQTWTPHFRTGCGTRQQLQQVSIQLSCEFCRVS